MREQTKIPRILPDRPKFDAMCPTPARQVIILAAAQRAAYPSGARLSLRQTLPKVRTHYGLYAPAFWGRTLPSRPLPQPSRQIPARASGMGNC